MVLLRKGSKGNEVRRLQYRLTDLGLSPGQVDGSFGEDTEKAVRAFQNENRIPADGIVGRQTLRALYPSEFASDFSARIAAPIAKLSEAPSGDVKQVIATQLELLSGYYESVLQQAQNSFRWAITASIVGMLFFMGAVAVLLADASRDIGAAAVIGGALIEVIAGINFVLYGKTTTQLHTFHSRLDATQRFMLANSICESLEGDEKQRARSALVERVAGEPRWKSESAKQ